MIDVENIVFDNVATLLRTNYTGIFVNSTDANISSIFPACTIKEIDNYIRTGDTTLGIKETAAIIPYQIDVYSNKGSGAKAQCKAIMNTADTEMNRMGFRRTYRSPIIQKSDSISRLITRYTKIQTNNTLT